MSGATEDDSPDREAVLHGVGCRHESVTRTSLTSDGLAVRVPIPVRVDVTPALFDEAAEGLPVGPALAEAVAVRLARRGVRLRWGEADTVSSQRALHRLARDRGTSSVALVRTDPSLLCDLQIGGWFEAPWAARLARRLPRPLDLVARAAGRGKASALEREFWRGVRAHATPDEWLRLTRSSYVALLYHRIAGENRDGEERLDVPPALFARQLRLLRALRFHPLTATELLAFHEGAPIPRRSYVITADDGFLDATLRFQRAAAHRPQLFVPTSLVGQPVDWAPEARLASWDQLVEAGHEGVAIGSHTRRHLQLTGLAPEELEEELAGSLADLNERLGHSLPILAYPQGAHDAAALGAAARVGYLAAYTTIPGRNGSGTDPYRLRRVSVKGWDSSLTFLWKVFTGGHVPQRWDERRLRRARGRRRTSRG